jgi:type II secretory pathway pseudopilin PulG
MDFYREEPGDIAPIFDDDLHKIQRQRSFALYAVLIVVVVAAGWLAITLFKATAKNPEDEAMLEAAQQIERAVTYYYADNAEYPDDLDQVVQYFPADKKWPTEPYQFLVIQDTGSPEFNGPDSIGMVHYEKIEEAGKTGYRLYVFGREGLLKVLWGGYAQEL